MNCSDCPSFGAGPSSIISAIKSTPRSKRVKVVAHNLTHITRAHLLASEIDVVIHQNMHEIAECAIETLLGGKPIARQIVATHVVTRENVLHHLDLSAINELLEQIDSE